MCEYGLEVSVEYLRLMFWRCLESIVVVFQGCNGGSVLSARLKVFPEVSRVVFYVVFKVLSYMFAFRFLYVLG